MKISLPPSKLQPLHRPTHPKLLEELQTSMEEDGWTGRPLLVIHRKPDSYFAWTGSHRIVAAIRANLATVPCYVIDERALPDEIDAEWGHVEDRERLAVLQKTGDETALRLMWLEGRD